jgi:hypothetical protein
VATVVVAGLPPAAFHSIRHTLGGTLAAVFGWGEGDDGASVSSRTTTKTMSLELDARLTDVDAGRAFVRVSLRAATTALASRWLRAWAGLARGQDARVATHTSTGAGAGANATTTTMRDITRRCIPTHHHHHHYHRRRRHHHHHHNHHRHHSISLFLTSIDTARCLCMLRNAPNLILFGLVWPCLFLFCFWFCF